MSELKTVYRYPPCPDYDVEATESWLADMAEKGLVLSRDGFFFGFAAFEKTEPVKMRYRLEAAKRGSTTLNEYLPPEEARELYESMGWEYVAARGNFHIYRSADPEAPELHTDPRVQALTLDSVRRRVRRDVMIELIWVIIFVGLRVMLGTTRLSGGPLVLAVIAIGTSAAVLLLALIIWSVARLFRGLGALNALRKKTAQGGELDHGKNWRKGRLSYWLGSLMNLLMTLLLFGLLFSSCINSVENKNEIPLEEFMGELPFATMADFLPDSVFEQDTSSLGRRLNHVELRSDLLAPVVIEYSQNGDLDTCGGIHISGGLGITYIEARTEWLAKEIFREFERDGKGSKHYKPLEMTVEGMDQSAAFIDLFPTVIFRSGDAVVRADFYQIGLTEAHEISLDQWAGALAASLAP